MIKMLWHALKLPQVLLDTWTYTMYVRSDVGMLEVSAKRTTDSPVAVHRANSRCQAEPTFRFPVGKDSTASRPSRSQIGSPLSASPDYFLDIHHWTWTTQTASPDYVVLAGC